MGRRVRQTLGFTQDAPAWIQSQEQDVRAMLRRDLRTQGVNDLRALAIEARLAWVSAGPAGIPQTTTEQWQGRLPVSGLVADVAVGGAAGNELHAATTDGGVWASADGGTSWAPLSEARPSLGIGAVARVDEGGTTFLFSGAGDPYDEGALRARAGGLERSIDGGRSWQPVDGGPGASGFALRDINAILALSSTRLLVATDQGLYFSNDGGLNFGADARYRDGRPVHAGAITALRADAAGFYFAVAQVGLFRGQVPPTAANITAVHRPGALNAGVPVGNIAFDRTTGGGAERWLASVAKRGGDYHSLQAGIAGAWSTLADAALDKGQTTYNHAVALDPAHPGVAWVGMVSLYTAADFATASPPAWTPTQVSQRNIHADQHALVMDPGRGSATHTRVYVGNDGGLYHTDNGAALAPPPATNRDWTGHNTGLATNLLYGVAVASSGGLLQIVAGMQDTGTAEGAATTAAPRAPTDWTYRYSRGGDGGAVAIDPQTPANAYGFVNDRFARRSGAPPAWAEVAGVGDGTNRFSGLVAVGRDGAGAWQHVYATLATAGGGGKLYRSTTGGAAFIDRFTFPVRPTALAVGPADAARETDATPPAWERVWVGFVDGSVQVSADAGAHFRRLVPGGTGPVLGIALDPTDANRVVAVYGGYTGISARSRTRHVFMTTDGGLSWDDIGGADGTGPVGNVPDLPCYAARFLRTTPGALIVGTDAGAIITEGPVYGRTWKRLSLGLPHVSVSSLGAVDPAPAAAAPDLGTAPPPVVAGTFGRSAFLLTRAATAQLYVDGDLGFGPRRVGTPAVERTITLANPGGAPLTVTALAIPAPFSLVGAPALPLALAPGQQQALTVAFNPAAAGRATATLQITASTGPVSVGASAEALADGPPRLALSHRSVGFGPVVAAAGTRTVEVTLENVGLSTLTLQGIDRTGDSQFSALTAAGAALAFPLAIAAGARAVIQLRFEPPAIGEKRATFTLRSDDPTSPARLYATGGRAGSAGGLSTLAWVGIIVGGLAVVGGAVALGYALGNRDEG